MLKGLIAGKFGVVILIAVGILVWSHMKKVQGAKQ